ncbi:UDP-glucose 4-epimerase GalE [Geodermatophilus sabuli]|uniref:UDP-glucose 4-epimerase n=1 Tax=Geodermatophilus sabuli TaxID=1564158 RepID=A0A285ECG0_9ACTN|nr:UDP-glucose 4-epimerase GalE [Geodermatophilus sabuli]MBB3084836.1 UDP-glucose 4-epimerase [Geodermatophilus sabuli]SNX95756.1 UDP-galactose 4-epimerase [Geodermatophilus sabuli]
MRVLVAGGAGYIGSVVTAALLAGGHEVTVLDDLSTGHADAVPEGAAFVRASLHDSAPVLADVRPEAVLHFAAKSLVGESQVQPEIYWDTNVAGSLALLEAMRAADCRRIVFSSTAATYGEPEQVPIREDAPTRPTNTYGATKLAVDAMLTSYAAAYDFAAVSLRYFNVAGAAYGRGERHTTETHLIPIALQVVAGTREAMTVYGEDYPTPDGTCIRDYIHVADLADAHLLALTAPAPGEHRIYNLGNGTGFSVQQVVDAVREVTGHPVPVVVGERRAGDPAQLVASSDRIRADLGWTPKHADLAGIVRDAWETTQKRA